MSNSEKIVLTKEMTNEAQALRKLVDKIGQAGDTAKKAQQNYCIECGKMGVKFEPPQCEAILEAMVGDDEKRKAKKAEGRKFSHPNVAPHVEKLFDLAASEERKAGMVKVSASLVARASKMATLLKEGTATTPESAADAVVNKAKRDEAAKATPKGAAGTCWTSIKKHMAKAGFSEADLAPVKAALDEVVEAGPTEEPKVEAEEVEEAPEQTGAAVEAAATSGTDSELESLLASALSGVDDPRNRARIAAMILRT